MLFVINERETTMYDSWSCLTVEKGPGLISDEIRTVLKIAACNLNLKRQDRMQITHDICDGILQTGWDTHVVGGRSGVLFRAQIGCDTAEGYRVNFLLSEEDLKRGADVLREMEERGSPVWGLSEGRISCDALYIFYDLTRVHQRPI